MHIRSNGNFAISGIFYDKVISSFTNLTFFFMLISSFSMCCGYYEQFMNNSVSLEYFYKKRYQRIWPFFALLCTIELIVNHTLVSFFEWFANLTLAFGLLPNADISVVGVGWFLGVIFVFYMIFPFFVFLIGNKKRAWLAMVVTLVLNFLCQIYFFDTNHMVNSFSARTNIIYSSIFFMGGGLIYLYRQNIKQWNQLAIRISTVVSAFIYFTLSDSVYMLLVMFALLTISGISLEEDLERIIFQNRVIKYLANISMEMYLCHMFVYRLIEKLNLIHISENEVLNYIVVCCISLFGAIVLSIVLKKIIAFATHQLKRYKGDIADENFDR